MQWNGRLKKCPFLLAHPSFVETQLLRYKVEQAVIGLFACYISTGQISCLVLVCLKSGLAEKFLVVVVIADPEPGNCFFVKNAKSAVAGRKSH